MTFACYYTYLIAYCHYILKVFKFLGILCCPTKFLFCFFNKSHFYILGPRMFLSFCFIYMRVFIILLRPPRRADDNVY